MNIDMNDMNVGSRWIHKNGNMYTILTLANQESTRLDEYPIMVVYQGDNGFIWTRKLNDWYRSMTKMSKTPPEWKSE